MRLIGTVDNEKQAFHFYSFLLSQGVHSTYEAPGKGERVRIWIYEEDQIGPAIQLLEEFKANPKDPKFAMEELPLVPPQPPDLIAASKEKIEVEDVDIDPKKPWQRFKGKIEKRRSYPLTNAIIWICVILYCFTAFQEAELIKKAGKFGAENGLTPIQRLFMFDYPIANVSIDRFVNEKGTKDLESYKNLPQEDQAEFTSLKQTPVWQGYMGSLLNKIRKNPNPNFVQGPLFEKIKEGEVWRLFTPALLHGGLLHILFNMLWVWVLLRQIEERLPIWKILILILILAIVPNVAQYLMTGPFFVGFSGVIVGFIGFIWVRQRVAPWEGYPLPRSMIIFIVIFLVAMVVLGIGSFLIDVFTTKSISANIANTAHIVGGICGGLLGLLPFFKRRNS